MSNHIVGLKHHRHLWYLVALYYMQGLNNLTWSCLLFKVISYKTIYKERKHSGNFINSLKVRPWRPSWSRVSSNLWKIMIIAKNRPIDWSITKRFRIFEKKKIYKYLGVQHPQDVHQEQKIHLNRLTIFFFKKCNWVKKTILNAS